MPPTGIRRWRPLMSSGTRAVSLILVGISHHAWPDPQLQKTSWFECGRLIKRHFVSRVVSSECAWIASPFFKGDGRVRVRYRITLKQVSEPFTFILSPAEGRGDRNADALLCV